MSRSARYGSAADRTVTAARQRYALVVRRRDRTLRVRCDKPGRWHTVTARSSFGQVRMTREDTRLDVTFDGRRTSMRIPRRRRAAGRVRAGVDRRCHPCVSSPPAPAIPGVCAAGVVRDRRHPAAAPVHVPDRRAKACTDRSVFIRACGILRLGLDRRTRASADGQRAGPRDRFRTELAARTCIAGWCSHLRRSTDSIA